MSDNTREYELSSWFTPTLDDQYIYFYDITGVEMFQNIRFYSKLTEYKKLVIYIMSQLI